MSTPFGVHRPHDVGEPEPVVEPYGDVAGRRERLAELREERGDLRPVVLASAGIAWTLGRPISALSSAGVPSATILPLSMIPTRSASTSASSRYCVVRKTVTPASRRSSATSSQSVGAALRVEPGRRLVEEEDPRAVHEREREVEAPLHAARVARDLAVGRVDEPDAVSSSSARGPRSSFGTLCSVACRRRWSRAVSSGSSAASCSATPISAADLRPVLDDVVAADERRARGRRQERRQDVDGRRLAGPVRAEEAVDLAGRDGEVDPVDRARALLVLADEPSDLDSIWRFVSHLTVSTLSKRYNAADAGDRHPHRAPARPLGEARRACFNDALAQVGGSMPMWFILTNLKGEAWRTQHELARALRIEGPTLTRHLDGLEEDGLVVRRRDAADRRAVSVELTDLGRAKHAELLRAVQAFNRRLLAGLTESEIEELKDAPRPGSSRTRAPRPRPG